MGALCTICTTHDRVVEFPSIKDLRAHIEGGHILPRDIIEKEKAIEQSVFEPVKTKVEKPVKPQPPQLIYKYIGVCPDDGVELATIELDVEKKHFVTAICLKCNKQILIQQVAKL